MARKGLYKYKWEKHSSLIADLAVMTLAVFLAVGLIIGAGRLAGVKLNFGGATEEKGSNGQAVTPVANSLHGAATVVGSNKTASGSTGALAIENATNNSTAASSPSSAIPLKTSASTAKITVSAEKGYASLDQRGVPLLRFELTSPVKARLKNLTFSVDGYASVGDLSSLQLYYDNMLAGQAPVIGTEAVFDKIDILLEPGQKASFMVKGNMGPEARSGDRVRVGISDTLAIGLFDSDDAAILTEPVGAGTAFPLWGGLTSVIGKNL